MHSEETHHQDNHKASLLKIKGRKSIREHTNPHISDMAGKKDDKKRSKSRDKKKAHVDEPDFIYPKLPELNDFENELNRQIEKEYLTQSDSQSDSDYDSEIESNENIKKPEENVENNFFRFVPENLILNFIKSYSSLMAGLAVFILLLSSWFLPSSRILNQQQNDVITEISLGEKISTYSSQFPKQEDYTWDQLRIGIQSVVHLNEPSVFLLTHWTKDGAVNNGVEIAQIMGRLSSAYLGNKTESKGSPVVISDDEINAFEDHGELIAEYKEHIRKNHALIINSLEKVRGIIAQGLRYFCDEYSGRPGEHHNNVIFLIMNMKNCKQITEETFYKTSHYDIVAKSEQCLANLWKEDLPNSILQPLLIRVVNRVLKIYPN